MLKNDIDTFDAIVDDYYKSLTAFAFRYVGDIDAAKDIVQDVFAKLWMRRKNVDFGILPANYLYVSVRNGAYNYLRSANRSGSNRLLANQETDDIHNQIAEQEAVRLLLQAVKLLPERTGQVILLTLEGLKQSEVAAALGMEVSSVKTLKATGIKKLRERLVPLFLIYCSML